LFTTYYLGESADELTDETMGNESTDNFLSNTLTVQINSGNVSSLFWQPAYFVIYNANAVISGVQASGGISTSQKSQLIGEAEFIRAYCYFYLTNLFGELPLVLSVDFNTTALLTKTTQAKVYQQVISDLLDAEKSLPGDFSSAGGQPIRANKWSAAALLARVYQYLGYWQSADSASSAVINSGQFSLVGLDSVFLANSNEAILQLQTNDAPPYATLEGNFFIPYDSTSSVTCWLTSQLLTAFEPNDLRRQNWVDSSDYSGAYYYYPFKYKVMAGTSWPASENYTLLRFAEQYLIRAEAEANLGDSTDAINDLNIIRNRAGLSNYADAINGPLMQAIQHEDRIEFFAEWGHRWLDLRRWGIALQTLDTISYKRGNIDSTQLLYPIPFGEIQDDPNLTQNSGY